MVEPAPSEPLRSPTPGKMRKTDWEAAWFLIWAETRSVIKSLTAQRAN